MTQELLTYLIFGGLLILALVFDLGLLSRKSSHITMKKAILQTLFWVGLAISFFVYLWFERGHVLALEYVSAYLMEWSLSIDNIFVFILIFTFFKVKEDYYARVLLIGILTAIFLRIIFISVGIVLVEKFHWILYIFGAFLVYTGVKIFSHKTNEMIDLEKNKVYMILRKFLRLTTEDNKGKMTMMIDGKKHYTSIFVVVMMLATTDVVFAIDSIPAVFAISQDRLVIYSSNIFAVLGLRSLFFLLQGAINKFAHLQQGIAIVLIFIGVKMLGEDLITRFVNKGSLVYISLVVILVCIAGSIVYSISTADKDTKEEINLPEDSE